MSSAVLLLDTQWAIKAFKAVHNYNLKYKLINQSALNWSQIKSQCWSNIEP